MKKIKNMKSKPLIFLLAFLIIFSIGGTIAYFYQTVMLPNQFKTMTYKVDLTEEFNDDWGVKKVYITNNEDSNTAVVLRVNYNEIWSKTVSGTILTLSNTVSGSNVVDKDWTSTFSNDFIDGNDGWYYYTKTLGPNESIQLLDNIYLNNYLIQSSPDYENYLDYDYKLIFNYEALDADADKVSEIWNKTVTINGTNVSWS